MILVDSSVWIDYFRGASTAGADRLDAALGITPVAIGDLMLAEVLRGFRREQDFAAARTLLLELTIVELGGRSIALRTAENCRRLRRLGFTVRGTVDAFIATWCIEHGVPLLHADRDFRGFEEHLGLSSVLT